MLLNMLLCLAVPVNEATANFSLQDGNQTHIGPQTTPFDNALLSINPVSVPAPALTHVAGSSSGNGFSKKDFHPGFLSDTFCDISFINYCHKQTAQCIIQPVELHLAFCSLRI